MLDVGCSSRPAPRWSPAFSPQANQLWDKTFQASLLKVWQPMGWWPILRWRRCLAGLSQGGALDFYNVLNSSVDSYRQTYGASWLTPLSVILARFAKLGVQFDF